MTAHWETITTSFLKSDKPYGGGAFRIHGEQVISLKLAGQPITFKPASESKDPDVAEPTEEWMNDSSERLKRMSVAFLRGTLETGLTRTFQHRGQDAAWWYSSDWRTVYISTAWMDYKAPKLPNGFLPQITKLWRSSDGGQTWTPLTWPEDHDIEQLLFLDPQRGYAIGWGPHVWRTADGGHSWREIEAPALAVIAGKPRKTFDGVNLGPDGVLRVACYVDQSAAIKASSLVYRLAWDQSTFEQDVVLPNQTVVDLQSSPATAQGYSLYALSKLGLPRNIDDPKDNGRRTGALSVWGDAQRSAVQQVRTFDERLMLDGLSVGKQGVLLVYATDASGGGAPVDLTFLTKDFGKSWHDLDDSSAQGGYFDPDTNTQYALFAYTLKKRRL
nr:glycosyl hydrolase [Trinickia diaoshuihuensis]